MKPKALIFPNERHLRSDILSGQVSAIIIKGSEPFRVGEKILLIPKNTDPWEEKAYLAQIFSIRRDISFLELNLEEIKKCGCNNRSGLLAYYKRFFDDDLKLDSLVTHISWTAGKVVDPGDYGYRAPHFNNQQSSAP